MRNECPLATNFGTNLRVVFLCGIGLFLIAGALWGGVKFYIAKCYFIYIDDIAQQKMYMSRNLWWVFEVFFFLLYSYGGTDFLFFWLEYFRWWDPLFGLRLGCFNLLMKPWLALSIVNIWRKGNLRNHCPLAANFGTRACKFAAGCSFICEAVLKFLFVKRYSII